MEGKCIYKPFLLSLNNGTVMYEILRRWGRVAGCEGLEETFCSNVEAWAGNE